MMSAVFLHHKRNIKVVVEAFVRISNRVAATMTTGLLAKLDHPLLRENLIYSPQSTVISQLFEKS
ncbi:hypothetical protein BH10PLA2_BH10PLA2_30660 [soil metagenome]